MPGPQIRNWPLYEALREQGHSKESAARIANAQTARLRKRRKRSKVRKRG